MNEETIVQTKAYNENQSSHIIGVSIRGWLAIIIVFTVCLMAGLQIQVNEPLYTIAVMVLTFYFGKEQGKKESKNTP